MIKVEHPEHVEQINHLSEQIDRAARLVAVLEARLDIAKGNRALAGIRFWDYAGKVAPDTKKYMNASLAWDEEKSAFLTASDQQQGL